MKFARCQIFRGKISAFENICVHLSMKVLRARDSISKILWQKLTILPEYSYISDEVYQRFNASSVFFYNTAE